MLSLGYTAVFGETAELPRGLHMTPTDRIGDFGHVDVTVRIAPDSMRREEVARRARVQAATPASEQFAETVEDTHSAAWSLRRWSGRARPHSCAKTELGHVDVAGLIDENLAGTNNICPLS